MPFVAPELAVKTVPFAPTPKRAGVSAALAVIKSPLASRIVGEIPASFDQVKSRSVLDAFANT
jgi:hypothetical protein